MHCAFNRDVINPQDGHILCDPNRAAWGFSLSIHRNSRIVNNTISRSREILAVLITATLLGEFRVSRVEAFLGRTNRAVGLAEKPKVEELQMDWLRSEDLNEEKNVTASAAIIAVEAYCSLWLPSAVTKRSMEAVHACNGDFSPTTPTSGLWPAQFGGAHSL